MTLLAALALAALWTAPFRAALNGDAAWTATRQVSAGGRALTSSGTVSCHAGSGIVWRVSSPFAMSVAMLRDKMVLRDDEGVAVTRTKDEVPRYAEIRQRTDAFAAGDDCAFDDVFACRETTLGANGWKIVLTPRIAALGVLFTSIEVTGDALPTNACLRTRDGGITQIRFKGVPRAP